MSIKYNHALTLAYEVISDDPHMPTVDEALSAVQQKVRSLVKGTADDLEDALMGEFPFDTFCIEEPETESEVKA